LQWKREQAVECLRAEALKKQTQELDIQIQYKRAKAADQAKIQAYERAENEKIQEEMEAEKKRRTYLK
jgi:hypothetical protein